MLKLSNKKILEFIKKRLPKEWFLIRRCNKCCNFRFLKNSVIMGICNFSGDKVPERFGCVYWKAKMQREKDSKGNDRIPKKSIKACGLGG